MRFMRGLGRGWMELDITREKVSTGFFYVSTVIEQEYAVEAAAPLESYAGEHMIRPA
jgi:alkaline phosphatase D